MWRIHSLRLSIRFSKARAIGCSMPSGVRRSMRSRLKRWWSYIRGWDLRALLVRLGQRVRQGRLALRVLRARLVLRALLGPQAQQVLMDLLDLRGQRAQQEQLAQQAQQVRREELAQRVRQAQQGQSG